MTESYLQISETAFGKKQELVLDFQDDRVSDLLAKFQRFLLSVLRAFWEEAIYVLNSSR